MKSYTDLEQSKKLAEILPPESADMWFANGVIVARDSVDEPDDIKSVFPCWSLAALLDIIPKRIKNYALRIDINNDFATVYYDEIGYGINNDLPNITTESAVDACYEMILKLHELNLL